MNPVSNIDPKAQKILDAVRTILAKNGYMGTTISLVAKEAGVSRGLLRGIMENDPDFFSLFFEGFAVARHSRIVNRELTILYGKFRKALETCLKKAKENEIINPGLPVEALAAIITGIIDGMGLQLLTEPDLCQNFIIWESIEKAIIDLLCLDR